jgi:hypothetical protein
MQKAKANLLNICGQAKAIPRGENEKRCIHIRAYESAYIGASAASE